MKEKPNTAQKDLLQNHCFRVCFSVSIAVADTQGKVTEKAFCIIVAIPDQRKCRK
jgi:hypothetical protein